MAAWMMATFTQRENLEEIEERDQHRQRRYRGTVRQGITAAGIKRLVRDRMAL